MLNESHDRVEQVIDLNSFQIRSSGFGEIEEAGEQSVEPTTLFLDDVEQLVAPFLGMTDALHDGGGSFNARQGSANLMSQPSRQLPQGVKALRALHTLKVLPQVLMGLTQFIGCVAKSVLLLSLPIRQNSCQHPYKAEHADFQTLVEHVDAGHSPNGRCANRKGSARQQSHAQATAPSHIQAPQCDRNVVQPLQNVQPVQGCWRGKILKNPDDPNSRKKHTAPHPMLLRCSSTSMQLGDLRRRRILRQAPSAKIPDRPASKITFEPTVISSRTQSLKQNELPLRCFF